MPENKRTFDQPTDWVLTMNDWGKSGVPFLFIIDFEGKKPLVLPLDSIDPDVILYDIRGVTNAGWGAPPKEDFHLEKYPCDFETYREAFDCVLRHAQAGNTYLLNLTCQTPISINLSLRDIFYRAQAKYRLCYRDEFVVFSPETFITIHEHKISTYPMKGTIDASLPDAMSILLGNDKELCEHTTVVDLLRNDLNTVAQNVKIEKFRYVESVRTHQGELLQVSSQISGELEQGYASRIGNILFSLLPAGSVSGAPKPKTLFIIREAERQERGYYCGVMGYFDGKTLDSGVMIRFVEKSDEQYYYRSGGGITVYSDAWSEYQEMQEKIYVPFV